MRTVLLLAVATVLAAACTGAPQHRAAVRDDSATRLTVGTVQREIHLGMAAADVALALGAPNIVTTEGEGTEAWIYDRFATEVVHSRSRGGVIGLLIGTAADGTGGGLGARTHSAGAQSRSQQTLTVVIRFDAGQRVRDFAYHAAQF